MRIRNLFATAILICALSGGGFAMIATLSLDELVVEAEAIAVGSLKMTNKLKKDDKGFVKIENTIVLSQTLKGSLKAGEEIIVESLEGVEDQPKFEPRVNFVLFLNKIPDSERFQTTNLIQGCWPLDNDNKPQGMGLGTTLDQLKETIKKTKDQKPKPPESNAPQF